MTTDLTGKQRILSPAERRARNRREMTDAILDAARSIMREHGTAALNLNEVARLVGVHTPALYNYFPSKAALYDALYVMAVRLYMQGFKEIYERYEPGWERIRAWFEWNFRFAQQQPELYQLWMERPVPRWEPSDASMEESREMGPAAMPFVTEMADAGIVERDLPPEQVLHLLIAVTHGITSLHMSNQPDLPMGSGRYGNLIPLAIDVLREGLAPQDGASAGSHSRGTPDNPARTDREGGGGSP